MLFALLGGVWSLTSPLSAAPDEAAHLAKAAGVARGQLLGEEWAPGRYVVAVPQVYDDVADVNDCFAFRPERSAACSDALRETSAEPTAVLTSAGRYNPLYYVLVGLPTHLPPTPVALHLVRLMSVLLCATTLAMGVRSAVETRARTWPVLAVFGATTPMVVFMLSVVNPSSLEITAGLGLWATLLAILRDPRPDLLRRQMLRAGVLVALLVNAKSVSPLYLAIIVLVVIATVPWSRTRSVLVDRRAWPGLALGVAASVAAVVWIRLAGAIGRPSEAPYPELTPGVAAERVLGRSDQYLANMLGQFGSHDTGIPLWGYMLAVLVALTPVVLALAVGSRRDRAVIGVLLVLVIALPVVLQVPQATELGLPWQGRYVLPIAVGLPLLAGYVLAEHRDELGGRLGHRLAGMLVWSWAVVQLLSVVANLRRYTAGAAWPFVAARDPDFWTPPLGQATLLVLAVLICGGGAVLASRLARDLARADETTRAAPEGGDGGGTGPTGRPAVEADVAGGPR
ncbi:DUF2142 domain-containing protein [Cellulomonas sp. NPDC058312]|uniref:DUF2142 domain-containing protein n=1 Tax=Cellulomonas sp. NPDC058312 TaxID=3346441 RepID=UPI0036EF6D15